MDLLTGPRLALDKMISSTSGTSTGEGPDHEWSSREMSRHERSTPGESEHDQTTNEKKHFKILDELSGLRGRKKEMAGFS